MPSWRVARRCSFISLNFARILLRIGVRPSTKPPPLRAVMRESEKIERLRLPKASSLTACYCMPSELDEPRLIGMKTEPKLRKASREVREEPLRVLRMLEADDRIVRIADDDHLTRRLALAPPADPQVIDIVEVDVSEERRNHRALGRPFLGLDPAAFLEHTCR